MAMMTRERGKTDFGRWNQPAICLHRPPDSLFRRVKIREAETVAPIFLFLHFRQYFLSVFWGSRRGLLFLQFHFLAAGLVGGRPRVAAAIANGGLQGVVIIVAGVVKVDVVKSWEGVGKEIDVCCSDDEEVNKQLIPRRTC